MSASGVKQSNAVGMKVFFVAEVKRRAKAFYKKLQILNDHRQMCTVDTHGYNCSQ